MREALRGRDARLLFAGEIASMFGDSVMLLVLAIWVKTLTGSSGLAGTVMLALAAPALAGPLFGWVVDRYRRRPFLIVVNLLSGAALLPLIAVDGRRDVWIIFTVAVAYGVSSTLVSGAFSGLLKQVVPGPALGAANGLFGTVGQGFRLVGPLLGAGLFVAVGGHVVTLIDMASFGCAAVTLIAIRTREPRPEPGTGGWTAEMTAGLRYLARHLPLRRSTSAIAVMMLMLGAVEALIFAYVGTGLHRPPAFVSVLVTAQGIGGLLGGAFSARLIARIGEMAAIAAGLAGFGVCVALLIYPSVALGFVGMPFAGAGLALVFVAFSTLQQRATPDALMGRVSTATGMLISGTQAISIATGAILVSLVDYRILFAVMAIVMVGSGVYLYAGRLPVDTDGEPSITESPARWREPRATEPPPPVRPRPEAAPPRSTPTAASTRYP